MGGVSEGSSGIEGMKRDNEVLVLIPARGGSKGLPNKNILPLGGVPLIGHTIRAARGAREVNRVLVSTDSPSIAAAALKEGADAPFLRPPELSTDDAPTSSVIIHALEWLRIEEGKSYTFLILAQPTSPFRTCQHISDAFDILIHAPGAMSLVGVKTVTEIPQWMKEISPSGYLKDFLPGSEAITRRQDSPHLVIPNGSLYIMRTSDFLKERTFFSDFTLPYVMDEYSSLDIDSRVDFDFAESLLKSRVSHHGDM